MKLEIQVPTKLADISLEKYQSFMSIKESNEDEDFVGKKMISIFCGIKMNNVGLLKKSSIDEVSQVFVDIFSTLPKFQDRFEMGGKTFGFIPNLEDITLDEYIDLDNNIGDWKTFHKAMAVMYRPIIKTKGNKFEIEPYISNITYADVMKYAPLDVATGAKVFFWNLKRELLKGTIAYLERTVKEMSIQLKHNLPKDGDGTTAYTHLLEETYKSLKELENLDFFNAYNG
jgi:hypothetical protein